METIKIQVIFEELILGTVYRDAIYYSSQAELDAKRADGSHEAEKATRLANYEEAVKNPPKPVEPTKDELIAQKVSLVAQIAILDLEIGKK